MKVIAMRLLVAVVLLLSLSLSAHAGSRYVLWIDAGSSGSRLYLFEYTLTQALPYIQTILFKEVKPGLSSFVARPQKAAESLKPLLDEAVWVLNHRSIDPKTVNIHILASGGMRALPFSQQKKIYTQLRTYLKTHYAFAIGDIKTIDGREEGLYGWLAVNYLKGTFQRKAMTVGSIDVGGASMQIAFATDDMRPSPDTVSLVINQRRYRVFSKSFLNLGQDRVRDTMRRYPGAGYCYPKAFLVEQGLVGSFELNKCRHIYLDILQKQAVKQQVMPPKKMPFVAYSAVYYVHDFFKIHIKQLFFDKIQKVCNKKWQYLQEAYPDDPYLSHYCANGIYIYTLLYDTYQLQRKHVTVMDKIQRQEIGWALGALLYHLVQHSD